MEITFERQCVKCGGAAEIATVDWDTFGDSSQLAEHALLPDPICARCNEWFARSPMIDPCKFYEFAGLPERLRKRLRERELGNPDLGGSSALSVQLQTKAPN
jgi:hypothetical protein